MSPTSVDRLVFFVETMLVGVGVGFGLFRAYFNDY